MADRTLEIILKLKDEVSSGLNSVSNNLKELKPAFTMMAAVGTASFVAVGGAIGFSVKQAMEAEAGINRLTQILKTSRGATDEQVNSLIKQADALEKIGVVSQDNIIQTQAQLATFDLEVESIARLTPAILDYVVAEKGANASTDEFRSMTNGLAQALQGNFASLTKTGFVLDDATKALIENGTEAERTAALVKVLNSTYEGFNESARNTAEGGMLALKNELNNTAQTIGKSFLPMIVELNKVLLPVIQNINKWVQENPNLTATMLAVVAGISGLVAVIGTLGLVLPSIIAGFTALGSIMLFLAANPIVLLVAAIVGIVAMVTYTVSEIIKNWDILKAQMEADFNAIKENLVEKWTAIGKFFAELWDGIKETFKSAIDWIMEKLQPLLNAIEKVKSIGSMVGSGISSAVKGAGSILGVNDAIITPAGQVIQTDPADYLIATKNPGALAGAGGLTIIINGDVTGRDIVERVGRELMTMIKIQNRL